jgi:hypothetical protein
MDEQAFKLKIDKLKNADRNNLLTEWEKLFGKPAPNRCGMEFLRGNVVYKLEEQFYGALSYSTKQKLRKLYEAFKADPNYQPAGKISLMRAGTKLVREYKGQIYEITALEKGFSFQGKRYASLSKIATEITGTRWNGKKFFGIS